VYVIRRARAGDVEALVEMRLAFLREELGNADDSSIAALERELQVYFRRKIASDDTLIYVAEADGSIVGTGLMIVIESLPRPSNPLGVEACITNMYTVPEWRGQGIASKLVCEMTAIAKAKGIRRVWLRATEMGRPVYEKAGFAQPGAGVTYMQLTVAE
jgi:GNAT superfamily N-acetyltransferase